MTWQPIETAPKHDRQKYGSTNCPHVIAYDGEEVFEAYHYDFAWYRPGGDEVLPTHWMPLPEPPEDAEDWRSEAIHLGI